MTEIQPVIDQLSALFGGKTGWISTTIAWLFGLQTLARLLNGMFIQPFFDSIVKKIAESPEKDDDLILYRILSSKIYRVVAFILDVGFLHIKLPNVAGVFNVPADGGHTDTITKSDTEAKP